MSTRALALVEEWRRPGGASLFWRDMKPRNPLREDQERVIDAASRNGARVASRGPRGWGKTTKLAASGLFWLATMPRSLVFAITPSERQTRSLFAEVASLYYGSDLRRLHPDWECGVSGVTTSDASWRFIGASSDNPSLLEGLHGENVMLLIDEGKALGDDFFNSAMGTLAGAQTSAVLATGTAGGRGWFYRAFSTERDRWQTFVFTPENSPHVAAMVEEERARLGDKDPFFRREYLAEFVPEYDSQNLFNLADAERCVNFDPYEGELWPTPKYRAIGVDPARSGDSTVLSYWQGRRLLALDELPHADLMTQCGQIVNEIRRFRAAAVGVDATGLGAGLADRLSEIYAEENAKLVHSTMNRVSVAPFVAGAKASPAGERFYNLKSEVAWRFKAMMEEKRIGLSREAAEKLIPDLLGERLETRSDGRLRAVDPPRSPDNLDATLIGLWASGEALSAGVVCADVPGL